MSNIKSIGIGTDQRGEYISLLKIENLITEIIYY